MWPVSIMEPEPGEYGEWVSAVGGGRGYPGESLIGTRECGSYVCRPAPTRGPLLLSIKFGLFGPTAFRFLRSDGVSVPSDDLTLRFRCA